MVLARGVRKYLSRRSKPGYIGVYSLVAIFLLITKRAIEVMYVFLSEGQKRERRQKNEENIGVGLPSQQQLTDK